MTFYVFCVVALVFSNTNVDRQVSANQSTTVYTATLQRGPLQCPTWGDLKAAYVGNRGAAEQKIVGKLKGSEASPPLLRRPCWEQPSIEPVIATILLRYSPHASRDKKVKTTYCYWLTTAHGRAISQGE